jgi:hypothetical protein
VWTMHIDQSKLLEELGIKVTLIFEGEHKVDGNPFEPLSNDARADCSTTTRVTYDMFTATSPPTWACRSRRCSPISDRAGVSWRRTRWRPAWSTASPRSTK